MGEVEQDHPHAFHPFQQVERLPAGLRQDDPGSRRSSMRRATLRTIASSSTTSTV